MTGAQFRAARKALGWSVPDAAYMLNLSRHTVYSYESGRTAVMGAVATLLRIYSTGKIPRLPVKPEGE